MFSLRCLLSCVLFIASCFFLTNCGQTLTQVTLAVHTYHDYGPPFHFYDLYLVRPTPTGSTIERINLLPAYQCSQTAMLRCAKASTKISVADFLKNTDPCDLADKPPSPDVVDITMQAPCHGRPRLIHLDGAATKQLLDQLNQAVGEPTLEIGAYANIRVTPQLAQSPTIQQIAHGDFDPLFGASVPDKISQIAKETLNAPPNPTATLLTSSVRPLSFTLPEFPTALRDIHWFYQLQFRATVGKDGRVRHVQFDQQPIHFSNLLQAPTQQHILHWQFPKSPTDRTVIGVIGFGLNCFIPDWP